jgi:hypothetical protein
MMADSSEEKLGYVPLDEQCHHYEHVSEVPWDIKKCV